MTNNLATPAATIEINDFSLEEMAEFYPIFGGHIFFQSLRAAAQFDLFSIISQHDSLTREQIAYELGVEVQPIRTLLLPLTVTGILNKSGNSYSNSPLAEEFLVAGSTNNVLQAIENEHEVVYEGIYELYDLIAEGQRVSPDNFLGQPTLYHQILQSQSSANEQTATKVFGGHILFQFLRAAAKFDLFSILSESGSLDVQEIAQRLHINSESASDLIQPLTQAGILAEKNSRYSNSRVAEELLVSSSPHRVLAYIELQHRVMYIGMKRFYESVKENRNAGLDAFPGDEPTLNQRLARDLDTLTIFQDAMQELSVQSNQYLADRIDLTNIDHVVDVGGGDGTNAMALANRWPELSATVFDLPDACKIADANIQTSGLADRVQTHPGNCFVDDFSTNADCIMFSHFFTIWSPAKDQHLLEKCYEALPSGGQVVLFNMMQDDDETISWAAAVGSPYFQAIATGEGMLYTWQEYEEWMRNAGFSKVTRQVLPRDHGCVTGIKE